MKSPVLYVQILISIANQTRDSSLFKNFAKLVDDAFAYLSRNESSLDPEVSNRLRSMIAYYVSQQPDFRADFLY